MSPFAIRLAAEEDVLNVLVLDRATADAPHWPEQEYRSRLVREEGVLVRRCLFIAELPTGLAGYAAARVVGDQSELESVVVSAAVRRQGVGAALCRAVVAWCTVEGAREMDLEVRASSAGAQNLYTKLGFVAAGRRSRYYAAPVEDAVLMRYQLFASEPASDLAKDCRTA